MPLGRLPPQGLIARIVLGVVTMAGVLYANSGHVIVSGRALALVASGVLVRVPARTLERRNIREGVVW